MSKIPLPHILAEGRLPSVEEKLALARDTLDWFSDKGVLVTYGSLARGDASARSDIDLCRVPEVEDPGYAFWSNQVEEFINEQSRSHGWDLETTVLDFASRRRDKWGKKGYRGIQFSVTTFDHFGFLARSPVFLPEIRQHYAAIQRDVRLWSGTGRQARVGDLTHYYNFVNRQFADRFGGFVHGGWRNVEPRVMERVGWLENVVYHYLRKVAGLGGLLRGSDSKASISQCFENPRVPIFAEILENFSLVRQFTIDCDTIVAECLGRPESQRDYERFLDSRLTPMYRAARGLLSQVNKAIETKTLFEQFADYDRQAEKKVVVADDFDRWLAEWREERECCAIFWWGVRETVYIGSPARGYVVWKGKREPVESGSEYRGHELKKQQIGAWGRFEIDFSLTVPLLTDVYARPRQKGLPEYELAAELGRVAAAKKLREILPADIGIITPSP